MPDPDEGGASTAPIPTWAMEQAREELYDVRDPVVIEERAGEIAREHQEREDERHDEYDDPDQGGEA
jgi:hypothetical protein